MKRLSKQDLWLILALLLVVGLVIVTVANYRFSKLNPGGTDFLVHWIGTRALFTEGVSPYSDDVALRIQTAVYGRAAQPGEHELRVAYPLFSVIFFAPFSFFQDYDLARALWMTFLEAGAIALTIVSIRLTSWRPGLKEWIGLFLFSLFWYHALRAIVNGNAVIFVALFLAGALYAIKQKHDELAGVLLAFSCIKPQVVLIFLAGLFFWSIFHNRYRILLWFVITLAFLSISSALLIPDWIIQNIREIMRYPGYNPPGTPSAALKTWFPVVGPRIGTLISIATVVILIVEWWLARKSDYRQFLWISCLTLVISPWIGIQTDPGNFITMVPAIGLVLAIIAERWKKKSNRTIAVLLLVLFLLLWIIFLTTLEESYQPIQSPVLFFPLPAILLMLLYWVRSWAIRPPALYYELFNQDESLRKL